MIRRVSWIVMAFLLMSVRSIGGATSASDDPLPFSCAVFSASTSATDLRARFGAANVKTAPVPWGGAEGDYTEGTVLFDGSPNAKLEIYRRDVTNKRNPEWVSVRGRQTRWRSPAGLTLGTALRTIEQLNGRPFLLLGFGSDVSRTVMTWSGGRLEAQNSGGCRVRTRLGPDRDGVNVQRTEAWRWFARWLVQ